MQFQDFIIALRTIYPYVCSCQFITCISLGDWLHGISVRGSFHGALITTSCFSKDLHGNFPSVHKLSQYLAFIHTNIWICNLNHDDSAPCPDSMMMSYLSFPSHWLAPNLGKWSYWFLVCHLLWPWKTLHIHQNRISRWWVMIHDDDYTVMSFHLIPTEWLPI